MLGIQVKRNWRLAACIGDGTAELVRARHEDVRPWFWARAAVGLGGGLGHTRSSSRPSFNSVESAALRRVADRARSSVRRGSRSLFPLGSPGTVRFSSAFQAGFVRPLFPVEDFPFSTLFRRDAAAGSWRRRDRRP